MTKDDFYSWKQHPVTKEIFRQFQGRVLALQETLGTSAGIDPLQDRQFVGAIAAYNDLLTIDFEDQEETVE